MKEWKLIKVALQTTNPVTLERPMGSLTAAALPPGGTPKLEASLAALLRVSPEM